MIKLATIVMTLMMISSKFLEIPKQIEDEHENKESRKLIEPITCGLTIMTIAFIIWFVIERFRWRKNSAFQTLIYRFKTEKRLGFADHLHDFHSRLFVKDLINRCLYTVKSSTKVEDALNREYFEELCSVWGRFSLNHLILSIKFFDVTYNLQFFSQFLQQKRIIKLTENNPLTVESRNKRFISLITEELEGQLIDRLENYSQKDNFRVMNTFYGGFWEVIFYEMFDQKLEPKRFEIITSAQAALRY